MELKHYIAFEGIEGAGKSVVSKRVVEILKSEPHNRDVVHVREPGGTRIGEEIRNVLLNDREEKMSFRTETCLFAASRAHLVETIVRPALEANKIVISDRTAYSSLAYQGGARGLGVEEVRAINEFALKGVWPGIIVFLELDPDMGLAREERKDRISKEGVELQKRIADTYKKIIEAEQYKFIVIDASAPLDRVVAEATDAILERL